ncbi:MAG TPA: hypothetical protein VMN35_07395 [Gaiellaceae bacterium]|nr:hypothetical protein [Gaiellaceae bacterium]
MADHRTAEVVRRELGAERQQLSRALDRLRVETAEAKHRLWRRTMVGASLLVLGTGLATAAGLLARRMRR